MADPTLSPAEADEFRARCRQFLEQHALDGQSGVYDDDRRFVQATAEVGLAGITYPTDVGGAGLTPAHDKIWREEKAKFPSRDSTFTISHGMCVPMIAEYGTDDQRRTYLPDAIAGRKLFCQLFSEPGAGSDVASLQMRAVLDGDEWIINGQKVWTTMAHLSDFGIVIARTDPDQPKHAGISMFIIPMRDAAVEIRPIHQINGDSEFNEVFLTDLRIPRDQLLGDLNNGWRMATAMLMYERVAIGSGGVGKVSQPMYRALADIAKSNGAIDDPVVRDQLMQMYAMESTRSLLALRTRAELKAGKTPGPGGSLGKLYGGMIARMFREIALEIAGPASVAWDPATPGSDRLQKDTLRTFAANIAGGTDEIQRNIIGDRVLGLPREPAVDRDVPFRDLKVGTQSS